MGTIINSESGKRCRSTAIPKQNFQTAGFAGTDANMPTGAGQTQFHNLGVAVFPSPKIVLKATYQKVINKDPAEQTPIPSLAVSASSFSQDGCGDSRTQCARGCSHG